MEKYTHISRRYIKFQKKRTLFTIVGIAFAVAVLFAMLTLYFSNFINNRDLIRKLQNYEMVFFPENEEQAAGILSDSAVTEAYSGRYYREYSKDYIDGAIFVNTKNPYRLNKYLKEFCDTYNVEGELNLKLAAYYFQGDIGDEIYIKSLLFLFIIFVFIVITVGIIRNSIQLNMIEQIKDYGILRSIGATSGQLRKIIFFIGLIQETIGLLVGLVLGFAVAFVMGKMSGIDVGLHIVPVLFVLIAFFGDLYFVMDENSKLVKNISPVEAVRGNIEADKRKIKRRRRSIYGCLFGVTGEYAYKSLMANKARFYKTVLTFGLGIAVFIAMSAGLAVVSRQFENIKKKYGEYQLYYYACVGGYTDINRAKSYMPSYETLEKMAQDSSVLDVKSFYVAQLFMADCEEYLLNHYVYQTFGYAYDEYDAKKLLEKGPGFAATNKCNMLLFGYDSEELNKYKKLLVDGTLDARDDEIIIIKQSLLDDEDGEFDFFETNNYKVGDTIDLVDFVRLQQLYDMKYNSEDYEPSNDGMDFGLLQKCITQLVEEGGYKTYTICGIVKYDKDLLGSIFYDGVMTAIVPLENYYRITGLGEEDCNGVKLKINKKPSKRLSELCTKTEDSLFCMYSQYIYDNQLMEEVKKELIYVALFTTVMLVVSSVNIINTSAGNLYLRRAELAQLRGIGMSKKKLCRVVLLEGIITGITANIIGLILGFISFFPIKQAIEFMYSIKFTYPVIAAALCFIVSMTVICGSVYFPIRRMSNDILENLNAGGD